MDSIKAIFQNIADGLTKVYTFVTSRRIEFFALVSALLVVTGILGLPQEQNAQIVTQLNATADKGVELLIVAREFVTELAALVGLLYLAAQTMRSLFERPITLQDHKVASPKG